VFLCSCTRMQLLSVLPKNGIVAEIGTAEGEFARAINESTTPHTLHLIDPWEHQTEGDYVPDLNNVDAEAQERRYRGVLAEFTTGIAAGQVVVHRQYSADAVSDFADGLFDFVYIDGDHSFNGAYGDLTAFAPKIKPDGFLVGHDYTNNSFARRQGVDTITAVNKFVSETDFDLILITLEKFPSYVLARPCPQTSQLVAGLLYCGVVVAEFDGFPATGSFVHKEYAVGDRTGFVPTFRTTPTAESNT
jgi:Methyltransferase domain